MRTTLGEARRPRDTLVLVVGAGPVGLTAAIELKRRGFRVRVVSKSDGPVHESRALGINRKSLQILGPSGAGESIAAVGNRLKAMNLWTADAHLARLEFPDPGNALPFLTIVPQSRIERILVETLAGMDVAVEWETPVTALSQSDGKAAVTIAASGGEETVTPDIVVGADGAHSTVRGELGVDFPGSRYETEWGLADVRLGEGGVAHDEGHLFDLAPVLVVVFPMRGNLVRLICDQPDVMNHVPGRLTVEDVEWETTFAISHRQARSYRSGNVFLAGDAAHIHSPAGARGMNLGIEDAAWLAFLLETGAEAQYSDLRRPVARRVLMTVDPLTRLMASDAAIPRLIRRRLLPAALKSAPLRRRIVERIVGEATPPPWLDG